jgi:hypothetical protein
VSQEKLGRIATTIEVVDGKTRVVYHRTPVVVFGYTDITLNSGGYRTATTKKRMNQASRMFDLRFLVFQKNFNWYVKTEGGDVFKFEDGITWQRQTSNGYNINIKTL